MKNRLQYLIETLKYNTQTFKIENTYILQLAHYKYSEAIPLNKSYTRSETKITLRLRTEFAVELCY